MKLRWLRQIKLRREIGFPILAGFSVGILAVFTQGLPSKWAGAVVLSMLIPIIILSVKDFKKIILIAIVVNMPLAFDVTILNHVDHQGGPPGYVISLMTLALIAGYIIWLVERPRVPVYHFTPMTSSLLVFIFVSIASIFQSIDIILSLSNVFLLLQVFLMYFYVINHVKSWTDFRLILDVWMVCLALEGLLMIFQHFTGSRFDFAGIGTQSFQDTTASVDAIRVGGTIGSPNGAAIWLTPSLAITMGAYLIYSELKLPEAGLALISILVGMAGLVFTFSRSGWFAIGLAVLILGALALKKGVGKKALLALSITGLLGFSLFYNMIAQRLGKDDAGSVKSRLLGEEMAYKMIEANPFGVGINNFNERRMDYLPAELVGLPAKNVFIVHNHYLLIIAETGLYGLLSLLWILLAIAAQGMRWLNNRMDMRVYIVSASVLAALAGYALHMASDIFAGPMQVQLLWFMGALITAASHLTEVPWPSSAAK
jgi:O-antigen ligase